MREILFRGKNHDGVWCKGFLTQYRDGDYAIRLGYEDYEEGAPLRTIIPETIGQYTGQKDKNGKKIFEGDILEKYGFHYVVCFEKGGFIAYETPYNEGAVLSKTDWENAVITSNIHDNPELLEDAK